MSKYGLCKALRDVVLDDDRRAAFTANAREFTGAFDLTENEREALVALDYQKLYCCGAHPFLLNMFAMTFWPASEAPERQEAYNRSLRALGYPNFHT